MMEQKILLPDRHHRSVPGKTVVYGHILAASKGYGGATMDTATEQAVLKRLARVEGQLKGIQRMVKDRRYCIEIIQQVAASKKALEQAGLLIMRNHIDTCVSKSIRTKDSDDKVSELMRTIHRFIR